MKREPLFETEAALCDAFLAWARSRGFTCYPETAGWDIVLLDERGFQIGVEAKQRLNLTVVAQALPLYGSADYGPDHRAILVPHRPDYSMERLLEVLGLEVFYPQATSRPQWAFCHLERSYHDGQCHQRLFDWNPKRRLKLPAYIPDVPAGVPSPVQLTPWKLSALHVIAFLEAAGSITRAQIKHLGCDPRAWTGGAAWLVPLSGDPARGGRYQRGPNCPRFEQQHPEVYAQVKRDLDVRSVPGTAELDL